MSNARCILFTDRGGFERHVERFKPTLNCRWIASAAEASDVPNAPFLQLVDAGGDSSAITWGERSRHAGKLAVSYLEAASAAALGHHIDAIVTAPVSKESISPHFKGQTDFLAERAGCTQYAMSFFAPTFKVVLATVHLPLREALERITSTGYLDLIRFVDDQLRRFRFTDRRIAIAGINPHAGEGGMFGREELDVLSHAVKQASSEGISVSGPHSADSLYYRAHTGEFDVVIAPYHDQGLIPVKLIAHGSATNVTLGLPYVRTSPDHGTAFSIAGQGVADASGMTAALTCAIDLVRKIG